MESLLLNHTILSNFLGSFCRIWIIYSCAFCILVFRKEVPEERNKLLNRNIYKAESYGYIMNKGLKVGIPLVILSVLSVFALSGLLFSPGGNGFSDGINYESSVCVYKNNELVGECDSNVLYNTGAELIESAMADGAAADATDWIELGNASAAAGEPQADSSEAYTALDGGCFTGTMPVAGTVYDNGNGNWTVGTTFTSSCDDVLTNVTHLINDADAEFAGNNFTLVTLQTNDQLTINWTIWVT